MTLRSQELRDLTRQGDALRMGMDWTVDDLGKPQVLVESVTGCSHPSSVHLGDLVERSIGPVPQGLFEVEPHRPRHPVVDRSQ